MQNRTRQAGLIAAFIFGAFASAPSFADKPDHAGGGKGNGGGNGKYEQRDKGNADRRGDPRASDQRYERSGDRPRSSASRDDRNAPQARDGRSSNTTVVIHHFDDHRRTVARDYYHQHYSKGRCPPGLAKKHNGCMPPGQARKWSKGRPLPRDVIYYDLPPALVIQLGAPPPRHRYVRVAADILLIAVGTGMVVDAIEDLSRM
ncbi:MAG: hypothetical protein Q7J47_05915 [Azoarcus sp.]|nr:hypothetical protein [Azoarcus sp.]